MTQEEGRLVFYDTESSGVDRDYDQIYQLAAIETDLDLNPIQGSEANLICRPRRDIVPSPEAFLVHKLDIDALISNGMSEYELAKRVRNLFRAAPATGIMGYNNFAYDDEMIRRLLFRNGLPPYEHEFKDGNYRADIYGLVRMAYAFRPEILSWPTGQDGEVSLKLEDLSNANGFSHENAHEALSDVRATIQVAKAVKENNPRLWQYFLSMTNKEHALTMLRKQEPLMYVSSFINRRFRHSTMVCPLIAHPTNSNAMICVDLRYDPTDLLSMSEDELRRYLFTPQHKLEENAPHVPLINIAANKQPIIVPTNQILTPDLASQVALDVDRCVQHQRDILSDPGFRARAQKAFETTLPVQPDAGATIYSGGFLSRGDQALQARQHVVDQESASSDLPYLVTRSAFENTASMSDSARQFQLTFRTRWNSFGTDVLQMALRKNDGPANALSPNELHCYSQYLSQRLHAPETFGNGLSLEDAYQALDRLSMERPLTGEEVDILEKLKDHYETLERTCERFKVLSNSYAPLEARRAEAENSDSVARIMDYMERRGLLGTPAPSAEAPQDHEPTESMSPGG